MLPSRQMHEEDESITESEGPMEIDDELEVVVALPCHLQVLAIWKMV